MIVSDLVLFLLHLSEQYKTCSHSLAHFFLQLNGFWHVLQILLSKSDFFIVFIIRYTNRFGLSNVLIRIGMNKGRVIDFGCWMLGFWFLMIDDQTDDWEVIYTFWSLPIKEDLKFLQLPNKAIHFFLFWTEIDTN